MYHFEPPLASPDCKAVTLGDPTDGFLAGPKKIAMRLNANRGRASAHQLKRASADSDEGNLHLLSCVDEVSEQCDVCQDFDNAPLVPIAGASTFAMFNGKLWVDLLFLDDIVAPHAMDVYSKYSFLIPARSKNPREVCNP